MIHNLPMKLYISQVHLHIIPNLPVKLYQNFLSGLGEIVLTRNVARRKDGQTERVFPIYTQPLFAWRVYTKTEPHDKFVQVGTLQQA